MASTIAPLITIGSGTSADYHRLKEFHYRAGNPGAITRVLAARYENPALSADHPERSLLAGVLVESLPALACALRAVALPGRFACSDRRLAAGRLNRDMRTISRVIVHPMFRSAGLAVQLVRRLLADAQTPYIEALAAMGRIHPFFKRAGMTEYDRPPLPGHVRLAAALAHEKLTPLDLIAPEKLRATAFLVGELCRFTHLPADTPWADLVARARQPLLSQPVYYLWSAPGGE